MPRRDPPGTLPFMTSQGHVIENPLSGERITIKGRPHFAWDPLRWELQLAPGGRVPGSHSHPEQEERFTVVEGTMRFRVGRRRVLARPGDLVVVPPGTVHHFANPGPSPARVAVESAPALRTEALLEAAAAQAWERLASRRPVPRLLDLAVLLDDFYRELRAPYLPAPAVRAAARTVRRLAARRGSRARR